MTKKVKRKFKIKFIPLLLLILLIVLIYFSVKIILNIPIKNIFIYDNKILTDQEIIELAGISKYPSFFSTTIAKMMNGIEKSPYVESVDIEKKNLFEVHITIKEYSALFIKKSDNKLVLESEEEVDNVNELELPILINYVPDTKYIALIKNMCKVNENIKNKISEITYVPNDKDKDRFLLYMNDGNSVYLTLTKWKQINYYDDVISQLEGRKGILNLDSGNHFEILE